MIIFDGKRERKREKRRVPADGGLRLKDIDTCTLDLNFRHCGIRQRVLLLLTVFFFSLSLSPSLSFFFSFVILASIDENRIETSDDDIIF